MKNYLKKMHKSASPDVIKKLIVAIKKMEQDIIFYENNWNLFKNQNFEYAYQAGNKGSVSVGDSKIVATYHNYSEYMR